MALVTAERLHRWKCLFCGSKDKNIVQFKAQVNKTASGLVNSSTEYAEAVKIVTCNQCGKTEIFAHSAMMIGSFIAGHNCSIEESEEFVKKFHEMNHLDPKVNPHAIHGPNFGINENT